MIGPDKYKRIGLIGWPFALQVEPLWCTALFDKEAGRIAFRQLIVAADALIPAACAVLARHGVDEDVTAPLRASWVDFIHHWLYYQERSLESLHREMAFPAVQNPASVRELKTIKQLRAHVATLAPGAGFGAAEPGTGSVTLKHWSFNMHGEDRNYWGFELNMDAPENGGVWFGDPLEADFFRSLITQRVNCLLLAARLLGTGLESGCWPDEQLHIRGLQESALRVAMGDFSWVDPNSALGVSLAMDEWL